MTRGTAEALAASSHLWGPPSGLLPLSLDAGWEPVRLDTESVVDLCGEGCHFFPLGRNWGGPGTLAI